MTGRCVAALLTGLATACLLTACGVPPSGVVAAGDPATGMSAPLDVYFRAGGELIPVPRRASDTDPATAVRLLFAGPTDAEAAEVSTALPHLADPPEVTTDGDLVVVRLPDGADPLSIPAQQQLVCTLVQLPRAAEPPSAAPRDAPSRAPSRVPSAAGRPALRIRIVGGDWEAEPGIGACPLFWDQRA